MKAINKKIYYKNRMCGGTAEDRNKFYAILEKIQKLAIKHICSIGPFFTDYIYTFKNMTVIYCYDSDNGIPYSIEFVKTA